MPSGACALLVGMVSFFRLPCGTLWSRAEARWSCPVGTGAGLRPPRLSFFILRSSLSGQPKDGQDQSVDHARADAVDDHRACNREDLDRRARDEALWLCQDRHTVFSEFFQLPPKWGALIVLACRYKFKPARSTHIYLNLS